MAGDPDQVEVRMRSAFARHSKLSGIRDQFGHDFRTAAEIFQFSGLSILPFRQSSDTFSALMAIKTQLVKGLPASSRVGCSKLTTLMLSKTV